MVAYTYSYASVRARKARWERHWGHKLAWVEAGAMGLLSVASLYALHYHHAGGYSLLGAALIAAMLFIWHKEDLAVLPVVPRALNTDSIQLDLVLESKLLAQLPSTLSIQSLWLAAVGQWEGRFLVQHLGIPYGTVADALKQQQPSVDAVVQYAIELARSLGVNEVDSGVVVAATLVQCPGLLPLLQRLKLKPADVISVADWQQRVKKTLTKDSRSSYFGGIGRDWASGYTPLLNRFAVNISKQVEHGYYRHAPSVHATAIQQLAVQLNENTATALVGGVGSGRTSIIYSLAERMLEARNVGGLKYYQVMSLNASVLISAGGQIENVVMQLLAEAVHARNIIIFLDEAQLFFNSGPGSVNLSQILLPILQQGTVKIVCTMTDHDWQNLVAREPALSGVLHRIMITEPPVDQTVKVLQDASIGIENKANAIVMQSAVNEAVRLASRYLPEMAFPGKAIAVMESASHYAEEGFITADSVQRAIEATTGAKVVAASQPERQQLLELEDQIHQRMINQTRAVKVVADALRRSRAGVASPARPVGSFLFLGPTGVGKTELAKALAAIYYGGESAMVRLDMSEYQQQSDLSRLLAPSTEKQAGVTLASGVRQRPSTLVLLDEIEKAHPDILNILLQILDEGRLTDSDGREVSFKDAIVIATSNAAADEIRARITKGEKLEAFESKIVDQLIGSHVFRPELLNRFDEIVLFRPLTKPELRQVVGLMLTDVNATLQEQQVSVTLTAAAADWLVAQGYDPMFGARPLRRMVQRTVENVVADRLLAGSITAGQAVTLDTSDLQPPVAAPTSAPSA